MPDIEHPTEELPETEAPEVEHPKEDVSSVAGRVLGLERADVGAKKAAIDQLFEDAKTLAGSTLGSTEGGVVRKVETGRDAASFRVDGAAIYAVPPTVYYNDGTSASGVEHLFATVPAGVNDWFEAAAVVARALNNSPEAIARINR